MMPLPAALYIHMPWCIKKCPYCDFNSHQAPQELPESNYVNALITDFEQDIARFGTREISSIFIGGGTPSLFSGESYQQLFEGLSALAPFKKNLEITLEANPGTVEQTRFEAYRKYGITRLSLGVQSFDDASLKKIGRIHGAREAKHAIQLAHQVGFSQINIDLMYGIPAQSVELGLADLEEAMASSVTHLSWYQFTLEPNTYFHKYPPALPHEDHLCLLEDQGYQLLNTAGFKRYEISAFHKENHQCTHNLNYWTFGDYFGIGAGAHGKLTDRETKHVTRTQKTRLPKSYLDPALPYLSEVKTVSQQDLIFEFMLNATRLEQPIPHTLFTKRTHLSEALLLPLLQKAAIAGWVEIDTIGWKVTSLGRKFTNDLQGLFL